jgi:hypothetical protein
MQNTSNDRVIALLKSLKIDEVEAAKRIGKDASTLYRITGKKNAPTKTTLQTIAKALAANYNWLLTGSGDMFGTESEKSQNPWKDALVEQIKSENSRLETELSRVWAMVNHLTGGKMPDFRKAIEEAGKPLYRFPGAEYGLPSVAQA